MTTVLEITCRDPIVSRDGRPFGAGQGNRMRSLDWPLPSVLAGSLRTALGKSAHRDFSVETAKDLLQVEVVGPLPASGGQLYFPAPQDCVVHPERGPLRAEPQQSQKGGCDWPEPGLLSVGVQTSDDFKPEDAPAWWPGNRFAAWLVGEDVVFDEQFLRAADIEHRTHVRIDPDAGAAEESQLFTTAALALTHLLRYHAEDGGAVAANHVGNARHEERSKKPWSRRFAAITLTARVRAGGWCGDASAQLDTVHPLGGERRLAHWNASGNASAWTCPERIRKALTAAPRVRMVLATPAIFSGGWRPGWLDNRLVGTLPGTHTSLRLVGVSIQRWKAVSGWSLLNNPPDQRPGPKPVKRMVPAGGIYFFEADGTASNLADRWLEPVSDDEQDRRDGFGLAAWGIW